MCRSSYQSPLPVRLGSENRNKVIHQSKVRAKASKQHHRPHILRHDYHDHSHDEEGLVINTVSAQEEALRGIIRAKGGVINPFPVKLHRMLAAIDGEPFDGSPLDGSPRDFVPENARGIVSWQPHGRCFVVHKPKEFTEKILPDFMGLSKLASFQRQLNLYGFNRITRGKDRGGYYHEMFLRGRFGLVKDITRTKVKGTYVRGKADPDSEPDFWGMEWVPRPTASNIATDSFQVELEQSSPPSLSFESASTEPDDAEMFACLNEAEMVLSNPLANISAIFKVPSMAFNEKHVVEWQEQGIESAPGSEKLPNRDCASDAVNNDQPLDDPEDLEILRYFFAE